ncbi:MAG: cobalamin-binding protein [Armatimonadota bacterium]|nr:cobalamin-binding protein [Armatimonadota bacterium]
MRIVSLLPSATEIVCALGLANDLVGISHDCDYPPEILGKPVLSGAVVDPALPSEQIDAAIRNQVHRGMSVYHLDAGLLQALRPDLILTQELCTVCAPSFTEVVQAAKILDAQPRIVSLEPNTLEEILQTILLVGELTGRRRPAESLVAELRGRIDRVCRAEWKERPRVACIEWLDPAFIAGHWVPEMVELAGGRDGLGRAGKPSFPIDWDMVIDYRPEVIVLMPCGFHVERALRELGALERLPGWEDLPAVRNGRVYATDASSYFNRPGPRIVTGLEILATILHPAQPFFSTPKGSWQQIEHEKGE